MEQEKSLHHPSDQEERQESPKVKSPLKSILKTSQKKETEDPNPAPPTVESESSTQTSTQPQPQIQYPSSADRSLTERQGSTNVKPPLKSILKTSKQKEKQETNPAPEILEPESKIQTSTQPQPQIQYSSSSGRSLAEGQEIPKVKRPLKSILKTSQKKEEQNANPPPQIASPEANRNTNPHSLAEGQEIHKVERPLKSILKTSQKKEEQNPNPTPQIVESKSGRQPSPPPPPQAYRRNLPISSRRRSRTREGGQSSNASWHEMVNIPLTPPSNTAIPHQDTISTVRVPPVPVDDRQTSHQRPSSTVGTNGSSSGDEDEDLDSEANPPPSQNRCRRIRRWIRDLCTCC